GEYPQIDERLKQPLFLDDRVQFRGRVAFHHAALPLFDSGLEHLGGAAVRSDPPASLGCAVSQHIKLVTGNDVPQYAATAIAQDALERTSFVVVKDLVRNLAFFDLDWLQVAGEIQHFLSRYGQIDVAGHGRILPKNTSVRKRLQHGNANRYIIRQSVAVIRRN